MPCFDKKLEASRSDFYMDKPQTREVDCVITSGTASTFTLLLQSELAFRTFQIFFFYAGEVQLMLEERDVSLNNVEPVPLDTV